MAGNPAEIRKMQAKKRKPLLTPTQRHLPAGTSSKLLLRLREAYAHGIERQIGVAQVRSGMPLNSSSKGPARIASKGRVLPSNGRKVPAGQKQPRQKAA